MNEARKINDKLYDKNLETIERIFLYKKYISLVRKSAYLGNCDAQFELGQHYDTPNFWGENQNYNPDKCVYWYTKACKRGHADACNSLAGFYEVGEGVDKSTDKALSYYKKAADFGSEIGKENHMLLLKEIR